MGLFEQACGLVGPHCEVIRRWSGAAASLVSLSRARLETIGPDVAFGVTARDARVGFVGTSESRLAAVVRVQGPGSVGRGVCVGWWGFCGGCGG